MTYEKFSIKPIPKNSEMQAIQERFADLNRMVSESCNKLIQAGIEPFLEYSYDENGLPKSVTVRPRRDDDPQVGNFTLPIK